MEEEMFMEETKKFAKKIGGEVIMAQRPGEEWMWAVDIRNHFGCRIEKITTWIQIKMPNEKILVLNTTEMRHYGDNTAWYLYPKDTAWYLYPKDAIIENRTVKSCCLPVLANQEYPGNAESVWNLQQEFAHMDELFDFTKAMFGIHIHIVKRKKVYDDDYMPDIIFE